MPTFIVVGAAKSGTTSLHRYLGQHPDIFTTVKEPSFFAFEGQGVDFGGPGDDEGLAPHIITRLDDYTALFAGAAEPARGEASVAYLYDPQAAERIRHHVPGVKVIAVLRNPVDRAYSGFRHMRRDGREPIADFSRALEEEDERIEQNWEHQWHYTRLGFYGEQLRRYIDRFPPEQLAIHTYDEFRADPVGLVQRLYGFLDVDDRFAPDVSTRYNASGTTRVNALRRLVDGEGATKRRLRHVVPLRVRTTIGHRIRGLNTRTKGAELDEVTRRRLVELYRDDIGVLQSLLQRDLSAWLRV